MDMVAASSGRYRAVWGRSRVSCSLALYIPPLSPVTGRFVGFDLHRRGALGLAVAQVIGTVGRGFSTANGRDRPTFANPGIS